MRSTFEPCIPTRGRSVSSAPDWFHEIKYDGYRLIVQREGARVRLITRNGHDWSHRFPWIVESALKNRQQHFVSTVRPPRRITQIDKPLRSQMRNPDDAPSTARCSVAPQIRPNMQRLPSRPDRRNHRPCPPSPAAAILNTMGVELEVGLIAILHGSGATEAWVWSIDTVIPTRETEAQGIGKDRKDFRVASDKFSAGPARLNNFLEMKRKRTPKPAFQ